MFDSSNNDFFSFTIDPYSSSFLHSPLMYCEFDNEFLINNEEQLTVIQQTETMKPDCDTASFVRASNCNLVEAASTDLNSSDFNGIVEDASTRSATNSVSPRRLLTAAAARRVSKRDRHSKIHTAQGPRDRRVRLSLDVARHFFKLQDMLGFDKPSRTVNWLLMQSEPAIQQLIVDTRKESRSLSSNKNASSTSECCGELENGNTIDHDEITTAANRSSLSHSQQQQQQQEDRGILIKDGVYKPADHHKDRHRKGRQQSARNCRGSLLPATCPQAKERRNRARYRARKRTKEKEESRKRKLYFDQQKVGRTDTNNDEVIMQHHQEQQSISQQLRVDSCGTFETTGEESGTLSQNMKPLGGEVQSEIHDTARQSERDHVRDMCGSSSLAPAENWSPLTAFYYPHNQEICQVCPVTEFQYYGTSWDA